MEVKLAIIGCRDYDEYDELEQVIDKFRENKEFNVVEIVSGGAWGADHRRTDGSGGNGVTG